MRRLHSRRKNCQVDDTLKARSSIVFSDDAAANSLFSLLKPGSNFQKAFSKAASISLDDTRCVSRPRLSARF